MRTFKKTVSKPPKPYRAPKSGKLVQPKPHKLSIKGSWTLKKPVKF